MGKVRLHHKQLLACVDEALQTERSTAVSLWPARDRWGWLTEVELAARIRAAMPANGVGADQVRMNAQGRVAARGTNHDIEVGLPVLSAVEVVYGFTGGPTPVPASGINGELEWMTQWPERHAVLFLPTLVEGYRVQKNSRPYNLAGSQFSPAANELLSTDSLQAGGFSTLSLQLLTGVVAEVIRPARGKSRRWTVVGKPLVSPVTLGPINIDVAVVGSPGDRLWAVVWSRG